MNVSEIKHVTIPGLRLHLRRGDPNMLWVNGKDLLLLNTTAADFIEVFIEVMSGYQLNVDTGEFKQKIAARMRQRYPQVPVEILIKDFDTIYGSLIQISTGSCPIEEVNLEAKETDPKLWSAPPRMDLALTYTCNNNCYFCYTGGPKRGKELKIKQWKKIIDTLWKNGIPQVVFTGGEPTMRKDLVALIEYSKAFVTGLVTNGRKLPFLAETLQSVSLDYVQVSLESDQPEIHDRMVGVKGAWRETRDGIIASINCGLETITNTTLTEDNLATFPDLIKAGADMGLTIMACNTLICSGRGTCSKKDMGVSIDALKSTLSKALKVAEGSGVRLEWYSPTCYKLFNPIEFGFGVKACSAAQYNMTIEPDGNVIPCQSWFKDKLGNILKDPWDQIWTHPIARGFREKSYLKDREECKECEYLELCYGACPLEYLPS